jgi:hypothetical protein
MHPMGVACLKEFDRESYFRGKFVRFMAERGIEYPPGPYNVVLTGLTEMPAEYPECNLPVCDHSGGASRDCATMQRND